MKSINTFTKKMLLQRWRLLLLTCLAIASPLLLSRSYYSFLHHGRSLSAISDTKKWTPAKYIKSIRGDHDVIVGRSHLAAGKAVSDVPSYLGICALLLDKVDGLPVKSVSIREEKVVCSGRLGITESLTRIFLSSWLVAQGRAHFKLKVEYEHQCGRFENPFIHSLLPTKPTPNTKYTATERDEAILFCTHALVTPGGIVHDEKLQEIMSRHVPMIERTMQLAMEAAQKKNYISNTGIISTLQRRQLDVVQETAVIHLPCMDQFCNNVLVLPYHVYLANIPRSVRAIDVIVPPECQGNYREHALDLIGTLRKFNPLTTVELLEGYPTQADVFGRFLSAEYVICGPGWGKTCLFPVLAQPSAPSGKYRILDPSTAAFLDGMVSPLPIKYEVVSSPAVVPQSFKFLQAHPEGFRHFAYSQPPDPASCFALRGRYGKWVQDADYAPQAQYHTPLLNMAGASDRKFRELRPEAFRPSTTYRWQEILYPSCAVEMITRESFCSAMEAQGIRRLFLIGDSLNLQMGLSLWMLLRPESDVPMAEESSMHRRIQCPTFEFTIQFVRNDELLENSEPVSLQNQVKNCHHFCYPWKQIVADDPSRTLFIVNIGAHLHSRELFNQAVPRFIAHLDSLQRKDDIVFIRTLVPGHKNCGREGLKPFENFAEYAADVEGQKVKDTYNWEVLSSYNDLMAKLLEERKRSAGARHVARMELLDVFPMTILRPDGHIADEFKVPETRKTDCLHYSLPGPVDWWSNLLFTQLKSL